MAVSLYRENQCAPLKRLAYPLSYLVLRVLCVWLMSASASLYAQNSAVHVSQLAHTAWRLREGAVPAAPNAIAQTKDGYIWVGTENGLYRFDGDSYQLVEATAPDHILRVQSLLADRDGSLWVGAGTSLYHLREGALHKMPGVHKVLQMFQSSSGEVYVSTKNYIHAAACRLRAEVLECPTGLGMDAGGFSIANDGSGGFWVSNTDHLRHRNADGSSALGDGEIPWTGVISVLGSDGQGRVWAGVHEIGRLARLYECNSQGWHPLPAIQGLRKSSDIQSIFSDKEGALWIGTSDTGLYRIDGSKTDRFDQSDGLSNNSVSDITQDAEGSIWIATSGGIDQLHRPLVDSWSTREGLSGDSVSAIVADRSGRIWMSNTGGLDVLENGVIHSYQPGKGLPGATVTGLAEDRAGRLWVGIDEAVWILDKGKFHRVLRPDGKDVGFTVLMAEDTAGQMWIRTGRNQLFRYSEGELKTVEWKYADRITALWADPAGGMWIGARGLLAFHVAGDATKIYVDNTPSNDGVFEAIFRSGGKMISETQQAISVTGQETSAVLNQKNGLAYHALLSHALSRNGDIYLMTENNYLQITANDFARWLQNPKYRVPSRVIDGMDGAITGDSTFGPASTVAPNGDLWFATDRFPQRIDPKQLQLRREIPPIHIQSVLADSTELNGPSQLVAKAGTQTLEIRYAALSYISPHKTQYRYLLEGFDTDWQDAGSRKQAIYSHLPPGRYRFRVLAKDSSGTWTSREAVAELRLMPHFYQTIWFKVLLLMAALCVLWMIYLARLRYLLGRAKAQLFERMSERERIARDLHDTFFQGIQGLLLRFQTGTSALPVAEPVRPMFEDLLKQSDQVMHEGRELVLDLRTRFAEDEDLAQALATICAEMQAMFPAKYNVIVQGKPKPIRAGVSEELFRIAKEAITNAFQHAGATKIEVEIVFEERDLKLRVRDDGHGIATSIQEAGGRSGHFGLAGMRERAQRIGAKLDIWSQDSAGTEIEVSISSVLASSLKNRCLYWLLQLRDKQI
jgi:signal transduction histidine kinase/ligand-binding sensor domain-containing protein